MRALVIVIGLAALLWSGYWLIGASRATKGTRDWLDARSVDGWMAGAADIRTRGFPNRFDTTLTEPRLALPSGQAVWSAPFLQILTAQLQARTCDPDISRKPTIFGRRGVVRCPGRKNAGQCNP